MPADRNLLLTELRRLLRQLERDLQEQCALPEIDARIHAEYEGAKNNQRTAQIFDSWRGEYLTEVGVAWILGCVFVRFLEDNALTDPPMLAGPGERMGFARDSRDAYFARNPVHSDRDYLEHVFHTVAALPGCAQLFDPRHNLIWKVPISADAARAMVEFWRRLDPQRGSLVHDFTDPDWDTRFLGDLYQDLSERAREEYGLCQTPQFVEAFILDRTLTPTIEEFGFREVRLIDPACGSGHFLLGAFERLFEMWRHYEPKLGLRDITQRVLNQVYGIDLNPYATAIARFRMLVVALRASKVTSLTAAPDFHINVAVGDSLLHGQRFTGEYTRQDEMAISPLRHFYETEDRETLERILGQQYHAVVGNPPYITVKDRALNGLYRRRFGSCHRQYSRVVPFMERFFDLAIEGDARKPAGYVGMIVSNAFMKREFGKKLIEKFIPNWDLTAVIDTSGAYIPGHGTPTAILFARNRKPMLSTVRAVMGIRGEPSTPEDPAQGRVWKEIVEHAHQPGFTGEFVGVVDTPRETFHHHPWSLGGGGASELKLQIQASGKKLLAHLTSAIGRTTVAGEDDIWIMDVQSARRLGIFYLTIPFVKGERVRDWRLQELPIVLYPYKELGGAPVDEDSPAVDRYLWLFRTSLRARSVFGKSLADMGRPWFEHLEHYRNKLRTPLSITFANLATHNHFVLDAGGKVFNSHAPVIKLKPEATGDSYLRLLGILNSSAGCFWMKQAMMDKGNGGIGGGIGDEMWERRYEYDVTKLKHFPITLEESLEPARSLESLAQQLTQLTPPEIVRHEVPARDTLAEMHADYETTRRKMITLQEELDWECYRLYSLIDEPLTMPHFDVPEINLGERAFEIVMARRMATGELQTTWFERHRSKLITEIPARWPVGYRTLVERRIRMIETDPNIALIEKPEYKRRWNTEPWDEQLKRALRNWLLDRLEDRRYWPEVALTSCAELAQSVSADAEFMQVAEVYRGRADFDFTALIIELVEAEAVPYLPALRYKPPGMLKRAQWMRTWELQRREDEIDAGVKQIAHDSEGSESQPNHGANDAPRDSSTRPRDARAAQNDGSEEAERLKREQIGEIPVPPKYKSADFMKSTWWRLRGALDVPKERFILYPGCERSGDGTPVIGWAGWNHLQQAKALAAFYLKARTQQGWSREKLVPLLAGLADLIPWLLQWHNDVDPDYNLRMGDYYEGFLKEELRALELPMSELAKWAPGAEGRSTAPSSIGHRIAVQEVTEAPEPRRGQVIDMLSAAKGLIRNQEVAAVAESGEQGPRAEDLAGRDRLGYRQSGGGQVPRDKAHK